MRGFPPWAWALVLVFAGCSEDGGGGSAPVFANRVIAFAPVVASGVTEADWPFFFAEQSAIGPPAGLFDVVSLGYDPLAAETTGGRIAVGLGEPSDPGNRACAVDGVGPDLAVYENPFVTVDPATGVQGTSNEVALAEVSQDGLAWFIFPPSLAEGLPLVEPARYTNFAGVTPTAEGGDRFDLAGLIAAHGLSADFQACYVRLTDGGTLFPDFGNLQSDLFASGADIDAVEALHFERAPGLAP